MRLVYNSTHILLLMYVDPGSTLVMATGLSRPGKSREGPGTGRDRTGQDLETLKVLWSCGPVVPGLKNSKSPGTFF